MKRFSLLFLLIFGLALSVVASAEEDVYRLEFSGSDLVGQKNDFGTVYLTHRKQNDLSSLLSIRSNYRLEVLFELDYQPVNESTGLAIPPANFGLEGYLPGFEPVVPGQPL